MRRAACALVLALGLLAAASAAAGAARAEQRAQADRAKAVYEVGREAKRAGDNARALAKMQEAWRLYAHPPYLFNQARLLQEQGRYEDAYQVFLRVLALPKCGSADLRLATRFGAHVLACLQPELQSAAVARKGELEPLREVAVVHFPGLEEGALVQIDGELRPELDADPRLSPGAHQVCILAADKREQRCWRRQLLAGVRTELPPDTRDDARASLSWTPLPGVQALSLDGHLLLVDLETLERIEVDPGEREVKVIRAGAAPTTLRVPLLPGASADLEALLAAAWNLGAAPQQPVARPPARGPGPWPWVVAGVGAALAVAGAALMVVADGDFAAVQDATRDDHGVVIGISQRDAVDTWDQAEATHWAGVGLLGGGGAVAAGGVLWGLFDQGDEDVVPPLESSASGAAR